MFQVTPRRTFLEHIFFINKERQKKAKLDKRKRKERTKGNTKEQNRKEQ